jgi:competence ComEA-like helix-hairpin-helix protein
MPTTNEKKALWFLAMVALSGSGVRLWRASLPPRAVIDSSALERQIVRVDSARAMRHKKPTPRPQTPRADTAAPPVDLDRASATEIEALPGIGPALAQRIVAARDSAGSFGQLEALCGINGVGPALVEKLRLLVTFTGARRPLSDACRDASKRLRKPRGSRARQSR